VRIFFLLILLSNFAVANIDIQSWKTPEGAKVLFVETKGLPMLDVQLNFDAASSRDGDKFGLATLTNSLIGTATKYRNEEQIIQAFESIGAEFSTSSLKDMSIVSMRSLTRKDVLRSALHTFTEVVTQPNFDNKYLSREKRQTLRSILASKQSPAKVAALAFDKAVFGKHPYAHNKIGNEKTIDNINIQDLKKHYKQYYVAKNLTIALVGDISKAKAKQVARQISAGLNIGSKPIKNPIITPLKEAKKIHIEFPSKQTHLLIGQSGINRAHRDYYPLYLGNHLFGGSGLSSILSEEIREKNGLAYSTSSYFTKMRSNGYFLVKLQTKNSQIDKAKKLAINTLDKFVNEATDAELLQDAKDNIIGGFALETASNSNILTYLSIIGFYDLPLDYLSSFINKIKNIKSVDVQRAFDKLIDMNKLIVLTVGSQK